MSLIYYERHNVFRNAMQSIKGNRMENMVMLKCFIKSNCVHVLLWNRLLNGNYPRYVLYIFLKFDSRFHRDDLACEMLMPMVATCIWSV